MKILASIFGGTSIYWGILRRWASDQSRLSFWKMLSCLPWQDIMSQTQEFPRRQDGPFTLAIVFSW